MSSSAPILVEACPPTPITPHDTFPPRHQTLAYSPTDETAVTMMASVSTSASASDCSSPVRDRMRVGRSGLRGVKIIRRGTRPSNDGDDDDDGIVVRDGDRVKENAIVSSKAGGGGDGDEVEVQFLVRLLNVTHVLTFPSNHTRGGRGGGRSGGGGGGGWRDPILTALSSRTGIPSTHLILHTPRPSYSSSYDDDDDGADGGDGSTGRVHFLSASLRLYLRGGKGGFGTQLKSASKRAAAKTTLDFGACRDLSGRRLRHVNDEVKLRKWREYNARRERGLPVDEMEYVRTKSGIHNWHLDVPNWALELFSEKAVRENQRRIVREMERQRRMEEAVVEDERRRRLQRERAVLDYAKVVSGGDGRDAEGRMEDAVAQGMRRRMELVAARRQKERRKKPTKEEGGVDGIIEGTKGRSEAATVGGEEGDTRRRNASKIGPGDVHVASSSSSASASTATATASVAVSGAVGEDAPGAAAAASSSEGVLGNVDVSGVSGCEWFCSLSGDFLEPEEHEAKPDRDDHEASGGGGGGDGDGEIRVQAASDFSSGCVLIPSTSSTTVSDADVRDGRLRDGGLVGGRWYYEIVLETAGVAQIGWATRGFNPDSQEGDGVGDDHHGYCYDGSRGLTFHAPPPSTSPPLMGGAEPQTSASIEEGVNTYPPKKAMETPIFAQHPLFCETKHFL